MRARHGRVSSFFAAIRHVYYCGERPLVFTACFVLRAARLSICFTP